ncbi:MAG: GntR family transcriptional regulator [Kiritimatiellae bacterium]|nr:GntR family transcriptional regulator [Kiritimatiellia bacterium]
MAFESKSRQIAAHLRKAILRGKWRPGDRLPSERDLLANLGVSRTPLNDALNVLVTEGLIERKQGSGTYVCNRQRTPLIAILGNIDTIVVPYGYYYRTLIQAIRQQASAGGYHAVLSIGHGDTTEAFAESIHLLDESIARQVMGVISVVAMGPLEAQFLQRHIPCVSIVSIVPRGQHCVVWNYERMARLGIQRLRTAGFNRFAVFYRTHDGGRSQQVLDQAVETWLRGSGLEPEQAPRVAVPLDVTMRRGAEAFKQLWQSPNRPRAIFFLDDGLCEETLPGILELGVRVPEDLAIVTHSNAGRCFNFPVPLTMVEYDPAEGARVAWTMLQQLMGGKPPPEPVVEIGPVIREGRSL